MPDTVTLHIVPFNTHNLGNGSLGSWKGNSPVLGKEGAEQVERLGG